MTTSRTVVLSQVALNITRIISHLTGISSYPRHIHKQGGYVSIDLITDCQLSEMLKCTKKEIVQPASDEEVVGGDTKLDPLRSLPAQLAPDCHLERALRSEVFKE